MSNDAKILKLLEQMNSRLDKMDAKINEMGEDVSLIKVQQKEHGAILSSLQTASEFHKADLDNLTHQVASLVGDVQAIKKAVTKGEEAYDFMQSMKNIFNRKG